MTVNTLKMTELCNFKKTSISLLIDSNVLLSKADTLMRELLRDKVPHSPLPVPK